MSDESDSEREDLELVGVHFPSIQEFRQAQQEVVSVLGNHIGMMRYRERLQDWYNGEHNLPFFMDLNQKIENNKEKLSEWMREGPKVFFLNKLPNFSRPEGFFSLSELSLPDISLPEFALPELSLPELPAFAGLMAYSEPLSAAAPPAQIVVELSESDLADSYWKDGEYGCEHYKRNCKVHCISCEKFYPCRHCHDEAETHQLPRAQTKLMLCYFCKTAQVAGQYCSSCLNEMGSYYCGECKLWSDDDSKPIFHCSDCGICRIGQGLNIDTVHCHTCGVCMNMAEADKHKCLERSAHSNCPICLGFMFNSTEALVFMSCGHPMHKTCYDVYTEQSYRCPLCLKSIVDTSALFRVIDDEVVQEQLPPDLAAREVDIKCNDCRGKSRVPFHVAGLKCLICKSYNTVKL